MTTFPAMKALVAKDLTAETWFRYDNVNYALCRIMIPIVNGTIDKHAAWAPSVNDEIWDAITIAQYRQYIQDHVLTPAGALQAGFQSKPGEALAYRQPHANLKGWDSGDVRTAAGAAGWRLSCKEVLDVMDQFRRRGTIVSPTVAQQMLDHSRGVDGAWPTAAGNVYAKNGSWGSGNGEVEQSVALFLPEDMEAVLFVNSPIGDGTAGIRGTIIAAYKGALMPGSTSRRRAPAGTA